MPAALAASPLSASALFNDRVEVFAAENVLWDSNIYRLDDRTGNVQSDVISTTSVGITANIPISLQTLQFAYTYFRTNYKDASDLDFNGHTAKAIYLWAITPRLTGDLGYGETQTLASFAQFIGPRVKDVLKTRQAYGNAVWMATPSWRVHGSIGASDQTHTDPLRKVYDIETTNGEAGVTYVTATDNRIGVAIRGERGEPKEEVNPLAGSGLDTTYKQAGIGVVGHWAIAGHSMLDGRAEYTRREYDKESSRDYSGPTLRLSHTWTPTGKTEVVTTIRREISPIDEVQSSNFVLVKAISIKPKWSVSDKITVTGSAEYAIWDYRATLLTGSYEHKTRSIGAGVMWRPSPRFTFAAGYLYEKRTSSLVLADYDVNLFTLEGRISF